MIQHLQNSLPVLILSTPYSVLEYSMLSTAVFHTKYWSHSASTLDTPKGIGIEWIELFLLPYEIFCKKNLPYRFFFDNTLLILM